MLQLYLFDDGTALRLADACDKWRTFTVIIIILLPPARRLCICIGLLLCLSVSEKDCSKRCGWMFKKFFGVVSVETRKSGLDFGAVCALPYPGCFSSSLTCSMRKCATLYCHSPGVSTVITTTSVMRLVWILCASSRLWNLKWSRWRRSELP